LDADGRRAGVLAAQGTPLAQTAASAPTAAATAAAAARAAGVLAEQIEQMVAPICALSDALLAQVFMAATYPLEIVQARAG